MTTVHLRDLAHWPEGADFDSVAWQANGANAGPRGVDHGTLDISYGRIDGAGALTVTGRGTPSTTSRNAIAARVLVPANVLGISYGRSDPPHALRRRRRLRKARFVGEGVLIPRMGERLPRSCRVGAWNSRSSPTAGRPGWPLNARRLPLAAEPCRWSPGIWYRRGSVPTVPPSDQHRPRFPMCTCQPPFRPASASGTEAPRCNTESPRCNTESPRCDIERCR